MDQSNRFETSTRQDDSYRLLVEAVIDYAIYMLDAKGFITSWNPGARRLKGYSTAEILGQHFSQFYSDADRAAGLPGRALETAATAGKFENEGWRIRKDGTRFWAHVVIDPIRDPSGTLIGYAKVTRDLSERKLAEEQLVRAREELFQSQKLESIGRLTGGIAHDFNNLLMAVLGSLELLRKRIPNNPSVLPLLENAMSAAQRGAALTQRMLAFARRQELNPEPVDVNLLVRGMVDLLQRSLGPTILIETRFPPELAPALADPHQLELAILNLAVNARDAMPTGGSLSLSAREMFVSEREIGGPSYYVCISVRDNGEGMDEETLVRAMEPFFTSKGVGKGTGLGLSMVHGMANQSGGRLVLNSSVGKGTTAEIWLPVAATIPLRVHDRPSLKEDSILQARSLVVLAVDDDTLVLMNTAEMLAELGHKVLQAHSGKEALEIIAREGHVDLVITDQAMPHMSGAQLAKELRARWPELAIVVATGYAELPPEADSSLMKLSKPFGLDELQAAVDKAAS
jgi:PAS domain S-box-containing protein